jgi:LPS O-antigen subunit length determinant protein (WzzB/FepE family)
MTDLPEYRNNPLPDDEIDLKELFLVLWNGKWLISVVTGVAAVLSVAFALSLPNIYVSESILAPRGGEDLGSSLSRNYGGLAALAGVSLPSGSGGGVEIAKQAIFSSSFVEKYLMDDILVELMAVESWDAGNDQLVIDVEVYDIEKEKWVRDVSFPLAPKPHIDEVMQVYKDQVSVSEDKQTGIITLRTEHLSPRVAQRWYQLIVQEINNFQRQQKIQKADSAIEYLTKQRESNQLIKMDEIFSGLIEEQIKEKMLASVYDNYLFDVIQEPTLPILKSKPSRALICVLGALLGGMLGLVSVLIRHYAGPTRTAD